MTLPWDFLHHKLFWADGPLVLFKALLGFPGGAGGSEICCTEQGWSKCSEEGANKQCLQLGRVVASSSLAHWLCRPYSLLKPPCLGWLGQSINQEPGQDNSKSQT